MCLRVKVDCRKWFNCDFPNVIDVRKQYYFLSKKYAMVSMDARCPESINDLPDSECAVIIMEGISMYLSNRQLHAFLKALQGKYRKAMVLMDVYTEYSAKASEYKNPVKDVGVTKLYGVDNMDKLLAGTRFRVKKEHSLTPERLVNELSGFDRWFFKLMFPERCTEKYSVCLNCLLNNDYI